MKWSQLAFSLLHSFLVVVFFNTRRYVSLPVREDHGEAHCSNYKLKIIVQKHFVLTRTTNEHLLNDNSWAISEQFLGNEMGLYQSSGSY